MAKGRRNINQEVLDFIVANPNFTQTEIAEGLGIKRNTLNPHIKELEESGEIQTGYRLSASYRSTLFKSFIFINTQYRGRELLDGEEMDYQQQLVKFIGDKIKEKSYTGSLLLLESVEIVMGAEFDIILILSAPDIKPIGKFVTNFLRPHKYVSKTQTITVWPSQTAASEPPSNVARNEGQEDADSDENGREPASEEPRSPGE